MHPPNSEIPRFKKSAVRRVGASSLALAIFVAEITPALATIDNTATATGTYSGTNYNATSALVQVPVAPAAPTMTIVKSAGLPTTASGTDATIVDAGDTILYTYTVKNTGNVTMTGVAPTDPGPKFNSIAGTGTLGAYSPASATLAPNATQVFTATYTLSQLDAYRGAGLAGGVSNTAGATGTTPSAATYNIPVGGQATATTTIPAGPKLAILKTALLNDVGGGTTGKADLGETITYKYAVTNTGNVAMTGISINDIHAGVALAAGLVTGETLTTPGPLGAGASSDATASNGVWSVLAPGATVTFTYTHTVTQAEINNG